MSESSIDIVKKVYSVINTPKIWEDTDIFDGLVWVEMSGGPNGGWYNGREEIQGVFARIDSQWENFRHEPIDFLEDGRHVVVIGRYLGINKITRKELNIRVAHLWEIHAGRAIYFEQFTDTARLLEAAEKAE